MTEHRAQQAAHPVRPALDRAFLELEQPRDLAQRAVLLVQQPDKLAIGTVKRVESPGEVEPNGGSPRRILLGRRLGHLGRPITVLPDPQGGLPPPDTPQPAARPAVRLVA